MRDVKATRGTTPGVAGWAIVLSTSAMLILATLIFSMGVTNDAKGLENKFLASEGVSRLALDKMWATVKGQAGITEKYATDFKQVAVESAQARYETGGTLMKWVTEHNPNLDAAIYRTLMNTLSAGRAEFMASQQDLLAIKEQHDNLRSKFPSSLFVGGRAPLVVKLVSTTATEKAFSTGKDDQDPNPFGK